MKNLRQLLLIVGAAVVVSSVVSHLCVRVLGVRTGGVGFKVLAEAGPEGRSAQAHGSSLMLDALAWEEVAEKAGMGVENWFVAGSSPSEWEPLQSRVTNAPLTFVAISAYDMNEEFLCDYRSEVAPFGQTVDDLWESDAEIAFGKRVLSQYVRKYVRKLYPTAGRSDGVMVGVREVLRKLASPLAKMESEAGPAIAVDAAPEAEAEKTGQVGNWSRARVLRRLAVMRSSSKGAVRFDGPKKLALERILRRASEQGPVVVMVLPVSKYFSDEFLSDDRKELFEEMLADVQKGVPEVDWIPLHNLPELNDNAMFWDLVHLNANGKRIATEAFMEGWEAGKSRE